MTVLVGAACLALLALALVPATRAPARILRPARAVDPHRGRRTGVRHDLVGSIESMSRDIRSGLSFRSALLGALESDDHLLPEVRAALLAGRALDDALSSQDDVTGDLAFVVHGLRVAARTGSTASDTLDRTVSVLRERHAWRSERRAQAAQARLSARVLTLLPLVVCGWGLATSARVRTAYTESSVTIVLAGAGIVLNVVGWWWMRHLVSRGDDG
jgi:tight adherence protein B